MRPSESANESTTVTTPSTVARVRTAGHAIGLQQGLRQRQAGGFDDNGIERLLASDNNLSMVGKEIIGHGAADAAIGEFDDIAGRAGALAAPLLDQAAIETPHRRIH